MRSAALVFFLLVAMLLPLTVFGAVASALGLTTHILTATPAQSVVSAEFDNSALQARLSNLDFGERPTDSFGMLLAVAGHGAPQVQVLDYEMGDPVTTSQAVGERDVAHSADELVILGQPAIMHEVRFVPLNFRPVMRGSDGVLHAVKRVNVQVGTHGGRSVNELDVTMTFSSAFIDIYRASLDNFDEIYPEASVRTPGRYLVITTAQRLTALQNALAFQHWMDLKKNKGYQLQLIGVTDSTEAGIRQTIQTAYNDQTKRDLEYALIIGDAADMPSHTVRNPESPAGQPEYSVGDNNYFLLAGNDSIPDVLNGRVSASALTEYVAYFNKEFVYETNPYTTDMHWFQSASCLAGNYATSSQGDIYPVTPVWNVRWARNRMMQDGCITQADTAYYHGSDDPGPGNYTSSILQTINNGVCLVLYRGWANTIGWQFPLLDRDAVTGGMSVGRRTPAFFGVVCGSANFAYNSGQCFGEILTTGMGTPASPNGAIIYFGATDLHTNTRHNNAILAGIVEAMMTHNIRSAGALQMAGKLEGWRQFPLERGGEESSGYYYIMHVFNLLGDPEVQLYVCPPTWLEPDHAATIGVGETVFPVTLRANGGASTVYDAVVSLRLPGTDSVVSARTDMNGTAYLPVGFTAPGTATFMAWKSGYFLDSSLVTISALPFDPKISAIHWNAGSDGVNPGDAPTFTLDIQNQGTATVVLEATITSADSRIVVTTGSGAIPSVAPGATVASPSFALTVGTDVYDGEQIPLDVQLASATDTVRGVIQVPISAPAPEIVSVRVDNANNRLDPGATSANIYVTIKNLGTQNASAMTATVGSFDNAITFQTNSLSWPSVAVGQTLESTTAMSVLLAPTAVVGRQIMLRFAFTQNSVVCARADYLLPTGLVTPRAPTGPDAYGYWAYEDIDTAYAAHPTYGWIELDPAYPGGSGGVPHGVRDDDHFAVALDRPFTYYGQSHSRLWVCSNGWCSLDTMSVPEFRNWYLPSPIGAPSLIAPLWDDLTGGHTSAQKDTLYNLWTRYDEAQNRFIIEWRNLANGGLSSGQQNTAYEVFEVIFEYPSSGNADGSIVFQYNHVTILDDSRQTGNYATVGMEDFYHERGLTLAFANMYPASVDTLRAGRAIRITTQPPDQFSAAKEKPAILPARFALHDAYPNPFNPTTELAFDLPNAGAVKLAVYDMLGREVAVLVDGQRAPGSYHVSFSGHSLPSGLYFARLTAGANTQVRKLMLLK